MTGQLLESRQSANIWGNGSRPLSSPHFYVNMSTSPQPSLAAVLTAISFSTLSEYLANRAAASAAVAAPVVKATKEGAKAGTKRKAPPASRGVEVSQD
jgi:hypothetical protein